MWDKSDMYFANYIRTTFECEGFSWERTGNGLSAWTGKDFVVFKVAVLIGRRI